MVEEIKYLRQKFGKVCFGHINSCFIVSWSSKNAKDLLISRIGEGVALYVSNELSDYELSKKPIKVLDNVIAQMVICPVDLNNDGEDDLIISDKRGFLHYYIRKGIFPDISFEYGGIFSDSESKCVFNIPFENTEHPKLDDLNGYLCPQLLNMSYPIVYPKENGKGTDLIIGDWAGNLWWMDDLSDGEDFPLYKGEKYHKDIEEVQNVVVNKQLYYDLFTKYGDTYVKPQHKICDENDIPFALGCGIENQEAFTGCHTRPALYRNPETGYYDLLVMTGAAITYMYYLKCFGRDANQKPIFKNLGKVNLLDKGEDLLGLVKSSMYCFPAITEVKGKTKLLLPFESNLAVLGIEYNLKDAKPDFIFERWVSSENAVTGGKLFNDLIVNGGRRFLTDSNWYNSSFNFREVIVENGEVYLSDEIPLTDQNGLFTVEGVTDPNMSPKFGTHRATRWDFDGSGKNHLIVGTDKGLLYLFQDTGLKNNKPSYYPIGPLKNEAGSIIKKHNRVMPCGIDLNGDGKEDIIFGAASYQCGIKYDLEPGSGIYYIINNGLDERGLPSLEEVRRLDIEGYEFPSSVNIIFRMQVLDIDGDGEKEVLISLSNLENKVLKVFKVMKDKIGLKLIGKLELPFYGTIFDLDLDGRLEALWPGGEHGIAYYKTIQNEINRFRSV